MTDTPPAAAGPAGPHDEPAPADTTARMHAIAAGLAAAGLAARLHDTRGTLDITAVARRPGRRRTAIIVDDDGYVELRYWNDPAATPAQITATITRALTAITTPDPA